MLRSIIANFDVIYQDTDSALVTKAELERFAQNTTLLGSDFGQFEIERYPGDIDQIVTLAPKNYFLLSSGHVVKKGFKGVNLKPGGDRLISKADLFRLGFQIAKDGSVSRGAGFEVLNAAWQALEGQQLAN